MPSKGVANPEISDENISSKFSTGNWYPNIYHHYPKSEKNGMKNPPKNHPTTPTTHLPPWPHGPVRDKFAGNFLLETSKKFISCLSPPYENVGSKKTEGVGTKNMQGSLYDTNPNFMHHKWEIPQNCHTSFASSLIPP